MREYRSNDEFFQALRNLMSRLEMQGNSSAAEQLREGLACLNGLTDGWALLMEAIGRTIADNQGRIDPDSMDELNDMFWSVRRIVQRG